MGRTASEKVHSLPAWERDNKDTHPPLSLPHQPEKEQEDEKELLSEVGDT